MTSIQMLEIYDTYSYNMKYMVQRGISFLQTKHGSRETAATPFEEQVRKSHDTNTISEQHARSGHFAGCCLRNGNDRDEDNGISIPDQRN